MPTGTTLIYDFTSDAATITASSADAALPVGNLQKQYPGRPWRAASAGTQHWIKVDFGASKAPNYALIAGAKFNGPNETQGPLTNANLYATDDAGVFASNLEATWAGQTSFGAAKVYKSYAVWRLGLITPKRYFACFINYGVATQVELGRFVLGPKLQFSRVHAGSDRIPWEDKFVSGSTLNELGHERVVVAGVKRPFIRVSVFRFIDLPPSERESLVDMFEKVDVLKPFFVDPYPDDTDAKNILYGSFQGPPEIERLLIDRTNVDFVVREWR